MSLPKQIALRVAAGKDWFSEYGWLSIPDVQLDHKSTEKENKNKSNIKKGSNKDHKVTFNEKLDTEAEPIVELTD